MQDNSDTPAVQHFVLSSHLYLYNKYIVSITPQTDFFGFRLWISTLTFQFMKLWIYLFLEVIMNFSLQAQPLRFMRYCRPKAQTTLSQPLTLFSPTLAPRHLVSWDRAGQRTCTHTNNDIYSIIIRIYIYIYMYIYIYIHIYI